MTHEHCEICEYNTFPSLIVGGTSGDYLVQAPVTSCRWAEFQIVSIANGSYPAQVLVSGSSAPKQLDYTGSKTLSNDTALRGQAYTVPNGETLVPAVQQWDRITDSQRRVFIRIDNAASNSTYITIRFRVRLLTVIPDSRDMVHPTLEHQKNLQRAERIRERVEDNQLPKTIKGDHTYA
jgi:hypothetical protein